MLPTQSHNRRYDWVITIHNLSLHDPIRKSGDYTEKEILERRKKRLIILGFILGIILLAFLVYILIKKIKIMFVQFRDGANDSKIVNVDDITIIDLHTDAVTCDV